MVGVGALWQDEGEQLKHLRRIRAMVIKKIGKIGEISADMEFEETTTVEKKERFTISQLDSQIASSQKHIDALIAKKEAAEALKVLG